MQDYILPLAICGVGRFVTRRILPTLSNDLNIKLTSVIGRSGLFDQALPDEVSRFSSLENYLVSSPVGAIYIATPNYLHAIQSIQCLKAGLHVICEKPMAINASDCGEMIQEAEKANKRLFAIKQNRFNPPIQELLKAIESNRFGKI